MGLFDKVQNQQQKAKPTPTDRDWEQLHYQDH